MAARSRAEEAGGDRKLAAGVERVVPLPPPRLKEAPVGRKWTPSVVDRRLCERLEIAQGCER